MSIETNIEKEELQEMARTILCEIYGAETARSGYAGTEFRAETGSGGYGLSDSFETEGFERRASLFPDIYAFRKRYGESFDEEEFHPRLSRREFLEQRILRRRTKEGLSETLGGTVPDKGRNQTDNPVSLPQADLPEKLSDIFCRDARRYDGAFERY